MITYVKLKPDILAVKHEAPFVAPMQRLNISGNGYWTATD